MGGVAKAVKKVVKGVGKVVKKVVKGVVKLGKKVVKGVGKVMGKLGPIGMIALAVIAPYAIGAMASSSIGWVSSIGQGLQAVSSAISAPFKFVGNAISKGLGQAASGASNIFSSITEKVTGFLSNVSGSGVTEGAKQIATNAGSGFGEIFGSSTTFGKEAIGEIAINATGEAAATGFEAVGQSAFEASTAAFDSGAPFADNFLTAASAETAKQNAAGMYGDLAIDNTRPGSVFDTAVADNSIFSTEGVNPFDKQYSAEALGKIDVTKSDTSLLDKLKKGLGGFGAGAPGGYQAPAMTPQDTSGYQGALNSAGDTDAQGGRGTSFYAQDLTGLMRTEDLFKNSLLGRTA